MDGGSDDPRVTTFGLLLEAHAAVTGAVGADLEEQSGLPITWFEVLIRLARSPQQRLRLSELAAQVALSTSGLTRLVDRVEEAGLIRRQACAADRRGAFAVLTAGGERTLRRALPGHLESIERHVLAPLGAEGLARLEVLLRALRDATGRCPAEALR